MHSKELEVFCAEMGWLMPRPLTMKQQQDCLRLGLTFDPNSRRNADWCPKEDHDLITAHDKGEYLMILADTHRRTFASVKQRIRSGSAALGAQVYEDTQQAK